MQQLLVKYLCLLLFLQHFFHHYILVYILYDFHTLFLPHHKYYNQVLQSNDKIEVPPYWIDMTKLFEMYVFAKLRQLFGDDVMYHPHFGKQEPDYLIMPTADRPPFVADAKYKRYSERSVDIDDIRQVSGYARMKAIRLRLEVEGKSLIPCVIIYPDQKKPEILDYYTKWADEGRYEDIFKTGIRLPVIKK